MRKIILTYGVISGSIVIISMILGFTASDNKGILSSQFFGYFIMLVALSMIFFGIKRHRDTELGGVIKFSQALLMGLGIAAVAGVMYVTVWEIYLNVTDYAFINDYVEGILAQHKANGVSGAEYQKYVQEMEDMKVMYAKFYIRLPMTFIEIFPVGVLISLISAALLKNPKLLPAIE